MLTKFWESKNDGQTLTLLGGVHEDDVEDVRRRIADAVGRSGEPREEKGASKHIEVLEVDQERYKDYPEALPLTLRIFESSFALSRHLGLEKTAAVQALWRARKKGEKEATLRGVRFCYVEDSRE